MVQTDKVLEKSVVAASDEKPGNAYDVKVSDSLDDAEWDAFLQEIPAGHHVQSSMWAALKQMHGWQCCRVTLSKDGQILAGAQFLVKKVAFLKVAYIPQGPAIREDAQVDYSHVLGMIEKGLKDAGILMSFITPPRNGHGFAEYLESRGLKPHDIAMFPRATTMVDVSPDVDTIMKNMKSKTRYNVRYGPKKGIEVFEVGREELPRFHEMLGKTAERNEFTPYSLPYFERMYELFNGKGHFRLIFASHEGEVISSILLIAFGDTVIYKKGGWSGEKGNLRPNEALHWNAIEWSKENGYRYYDFEGIREDSARAALAGEDIPDDALNHYSRFKLGFGGDVLILPKTYLYSRNPILNWFGNQPQLLKLGMDLAAKLRER